jgi:hypothetical protein
VRERGADAQGAGDTEGASALLDCLREGASTEKPTIRGCDPRAFADLPDRYPSVAHGQHNEQVGQCWGGGAAKNWECSALGCVRACMRACMRALKATFLVVGLMPRVIGVVFTAQCGAFRMARLDPKSQTGDQIRRP